MALKTKRNQQNNETPQWLQDLLKSQEERHQEQMDIMRDLLTSRTENDNSNDEDSRQQRQEKLNNVPRPPTLEADTNFSNFVNWRESWNDYYMLSKMNRLPEEEQRALFRSCLSTDMKSLLQCAIGVSNDEACTVDSILDRIRNHLRNKRNVALDRVAFTERKQAEGEEFDHFFVALRKLADNADICANCKDTRLATQIMSGVKNCELKQKLLAITPFPALQNVVDICRSFESSLKDTAVLQGQNISKIHQKKTNFKKSTSSGSSNNEQCSYCNRNRHSSRNDCPALNSTCRHCKRKGHWDIVCRSKKSETDRQESSNNEKNTTINTLRTNSVSKSEMATPKIMIKMKADKRNFTNIMAIPDTGAEVTVGGKHLLKKLQIDLRDLNQINDENLIAANGSQIKVIGSVRVTFTLNNISVHGKLIICDQQQDLLLSWRLCRELQLIPADFPQQIRSFSFKKKISADDILKHKEDLMQEFQDVFESSEELKPMKGEPMKIHLTH